MISPSDRTELSPGVTLNADGLHDPVRNATFPLNESARVVVSASSVADAAVALAQTFAVAADRALADATSFCAELNDRLLLEIAPRGGALRLALRWLVVAALLLPGRVVPRVPARRRQIDTGGRIALVRSGSRALLGPGAALAAGAGLAALLVARRPLLALAVSLAVGIGLVVHELGHLALLRGVPACVVVRGFRVSIWHRRLDPRREARVALAGPAAGIAACAVSLGALELRPCAELAAATLLGAAQLLGLTMLTRDGRRACARS